MTDLPTFAQIANRCRDTRGSRILDGDIFHLLHHRDGGEWSRDWHDDVWHRQDPEDRGAWEGPPAYTTCTDAAIGTRRPGSKLTITETDRRWTVTNDIPERNMAVDGSGHLLASAICTATMSVRSILANETVKP